MSRNFRLTAAAIAVLSAATALAVPAKRTPFTVTQPDGTTVTLVRCGDESMHFTTTIDGKIVCEDADGQFSYGRIAADGTLQSTGIKALDPANRQASVEYLMQDISTLDLQKISAARAKANVTPHRLTPYRVAPQAMKAAGRQRIAQTGMGRFTSAFPNKGRIKGLVILVEYKDIKFNTNYKVSPADYFTNLVKGENFTEYNGTGSAAQYFREQSMGQFDPEFDVYGPVTLPYNRNVYGGNDAYGDDKAPEDMVIHACRLLDSQVDFSQYDNDGDGVVDNVFIIYAGQGEASGGPSESVWPHSWNVTSAGKNVRCDGVLLDRYACTNEWEGSRPDGVGTFIHEFSHVMGLPDLYSTGSSSLSCTPQEWSVMDYGPYNNDGRTPPSYSIFERNAMEWIEPEVYEDPQFVNLEHIATSNEGGIILTEKDTEFFLFENRQQSGWDTYLPGHGMLIWHVDFVQGIFDANTPNNNASHQYVDIVEACGTTSGHNATVMAGYAWPGTKNKTAFTSETTPALKSWAGNAIDVPITDIEEEDGIIKFAVSGGQGIATPTVSQEPEVGSDFFYAKWDAVEGATDYLLTVSAIQDFGPLTEETAGMGSGTLASFPTGWSASGNTTYTTPSNYGAASPSLKMANDGAYLTTAVYPADIKKLSLWYKGMNTRNSGSELTIYGRPATAASAAQKAEAEWQVLENITPESEKANTAEFEIPAGIRQLKFVYTKDTGNLAIDDITITSGGQSESVLPDYNEISTDGLTAVRIDKLLAGVSQYKYWVRATDGKIKSKASTPVTVNFTEGVDNILEDAAEGVAIAIDGRVLTVSGGADRADIFDATGRLVVSRRLSNGHATVDLPAQGLYIVRAGARTAKVAAH